MTDLYRCPDCSRSYRADKLAECPGCGESTAQEAKILSAPSNKYSTIEHQSSRSGEANTAALVEAQNRTTHAVRSLAVFFFDWLLTSVIASTCILVGFWIYFAFSSSSAAQVFGSVLIVLGALAIIFGFFSALKSGLRELHKSYPN